MNNPKVVVGYDKWEDFSAKCIRTESTSFHNDRILHGIIGVVTELGEAIDALKKSLYYGKELDIVNLKEEIGDILWYLSILTDALDIKISNDVWGLRIEEVSNVFDKERVIKDKTIQLNMLNDLLYCVIQIGYISKDYELNELIHVPDDLTLLSEAKIEAIINVLSRVANDLGSDLSVISDTVIKKLQVRYPEKFDEKKAEVRDLKGERNVLES